MYHGIVRAMLHQSTRPRPMSSHEDTPTPNLRRELVVIGLVVVAIVFAEFTIWKVTHEPRHTLPTPKSVVR